MGVRDYKGGAPRTNLAAGISSSDMTFSAVASGGTGYPTGSGGDFVVAIDTGLAGEEKILCSGRAGDVFTVATGGRGWDDTTAAAHNNGAVVDHVGTATDLREANAHVNATGAAHGATGAVVGTTNTQTLTNKTLTTPTIGSFTNAQHDHSGPAGGSKLAQTNTHQTPDTDSSPSALHHTLGAGANQAAAGNHTHASSSGGLLGYCQYDPGSAVLKLTTSLTFSALDTTNLRATFVAPASGVVKVEFGAWGSSNGNASNGPIMGVLDGTTVKAASGYIGIGGAGSASSFAPITVARRISGLTPGATYNWDLACASSDAAANVAVQWGGGFNGYGAAYLFVSAA